MKKNSLYHHPTIPKIASNDNCLINTFLSKNRLKDFSPAKAGFEMTQLVILLINKGNAFINNSK